MNRYRHFDDEIHSTNLNTSAIIPEIDIDESDQVEFQVPRSNHSSKSQSLKAFFWQRTWLERCLFIGLISLSIILIAHVFFSRRRSNSSESFCLTPICIQLSHSISSAMNQTADPCDDFYEFACGRWVQTNTIPQGHASWSMMKVLSGQNLIILKNILEQESKSETVAEQKAKKFYQSCMNIAELERLNLQPLETFFQFNLNWTLTQWSQLDRSQTYEKLFVDLTRRLLINFDYSNILPISVLPDEKNSSWYSIHIDQPHLVLESRDYYINSTVNPQLNVKHQLIRDKYRQIGSEILRTLGFNSTDAVERMNAVIQFETELAAISLPMEVLQKPKETYALLALKQLQEQYQSIGFDIYSFFNSMINADRPTPVQLGETDQVVVLSLSLMSNLSKILTGYLLTSEKSHIVIDYLLFSLVFDFSSELPPSFDKLRTPLRKQLFGTDSLPDRWETCVKKTDVAFGGALGALYVKAVFGESDRQEANALIRDLRVTFRENLDQLPWIDQSSKNEAEKKLGKIDEKIGYPDYIRNATQLNRRYAGEPMLGNEYFNNRVKVSHRERRRTLLRFRERVDRTEWSMTPRTVNAYYSASSNEIVFPAGILQPPFFHKDLPFAINYGAIGSVIGHELTHGFDNQGREYDADGNMRPWWSDEALRKYDEKTKCFVEQYSSFSIDNQNIDGQRTLGENIADNGGIKLAYLAYEKHKEHKSTSNLPLPGLNYSNDQLFFIAFAHSWCQLETIEAVHYNLINDPHSPARFRISGTLANSEQFAKSFACASKSKLNPNSKCQLW